MYRRANPAIENTERVLNELRSVMHELARECYPTIENTERRAYYPGEIVHFNGNNADNSWGNLAITCPCCTGLIMLSRYTPQDLWLLKAGGLSYAKIGQLIGISRERVRQLCKRYEAPSVDVDELVKQAQEMERYWQYDFDDEDGRPVNKKTGRKRLTDRRTWKKRIIAEAKRMGFIPKQKGGIK